MAQSKNEKKPTPFQEELIKAAKTVKEYKLACEANIVSIFYKKPDLMYDLKILQKIHGEFIGRLHLI